MRTTSRSLQMQLRPLHRWTQPVDDRLPMTFREVYIQPVLPEDFRHNARSELGTRTATLHRAGLLKMRSNWVYLLAPNHE